MFRYHQRYGKTFEVGSLIGKTAIIPIAPETFAVSTLLVRAGASNLSGYQPLSTFVAVDFLEQMAQRGSTRENCSNPTFNKANLLDLAALSAEVDQFISNLPADGSTVDLQPMLS